MNPSDNDSDLPAAADATAPTEADPAVKPRRRRAAVTTAAPEAGLAGDAAPLSADILPATDVAAVDVAPAKPRRTRRKTQPEAADAASAADLAPTMAPAEATPAAAPPVPAAALPPAGSAQDRAHTPAELLAAAATPSADPATAGEQSQGEGQRRRNRNRRRGRRGGGEAGEGSDGAVVVTVTASPDDDDADSQAGEPGEAAAAAVVAAPDAGEAFAYVMSADYDAEPAPADGALSERRVLAAEPDSPKLHKVLAQAGIGSRREMEELIAAGQVQVNGQSAHIGQRISFGDRISVGGRLIKVRVVPAPARVIAYHKPVGEVVTHDDPQQRPTVFRRLPRLPQGKWQSVGRLDINTEGLLLFTTSGELANQLMHPRFGVEREYAARVIGRLDDEARARLLEGVDVDGQRAAFRSIEDGGGEGVNHWYRVVIAEGRNREVRKMFDRVGLGVSRLIRIRYGCVVLPRGLRRGAFVDLNSREVQQLRQLAAPSQGPREGPRESPRPAEGSEGRSGGKRNRRNKRGPEPRGEVRDRPSGAQGARTERVRNPDHDEVDFGAIPNPLQQTFDKRAIREARQPKREIAEDGPIPNPLEQTYDKRAVQKPRTPGSGGRQGGQGGAGQPDPMKTSVGYIGADAFVRKFQGGGGGRWGGKRGGGGGRR